MTNPMPQTFEDYLRAEEKRSFTRYNLPDEIFGMIDDWHSQEKERVLGELSAEKLKDLTHDFFGENSTDDHWGLATAIRELIEKEMR